MHTVSSGTASHSHSTAGGMSRAKGTDLNRERRSFSEAPSSTRS